MRFQIISFVVLTNYLRYNSILLIIMELCVCGICKLFFTATSIEMGRAF